MIKGSSKPSPRPSPARGRGSLLALSAGDEIPRNGGPGITRSDLLAINKTGLAPHVGASLDVMKAGGLA